VKNVENEGFPVSYENISVVVDMFQIDILTDPPIKNQTYFLITYIYTHIIFINKYE